MDRHGRWAILLCRPIPVLAEASVVFAGLVRTPLVPFLALTAGSNLGIALAYAAVGAYSMEAQSFLLTFLGALALPGLALLAGGYGLADPAPPGASDPASDRPIRSSNAVSSSVNVRSWRFAIPSAPTARSSLRIGTTIEPCSPVASAPGRTSPVVSVWMLQAVTG